MKSLYESGQASSKGVYSVAEKAKMVEIHRAFLAAFPRTEIPDCLKMVDDGSRLRSLRQITTFDFLKDSWVIRLQNGLFKTHAAKMISIICLTMTEQNTDPISDLNCPQYLVLYELLEWITTTLSGSHCNDRILDQARSRCAYLNMLINECEIFSPSSNLLRERHVLEQLRDELTGEIIPTLQRRVSNNFHELFRQCHHHGELTLKLVIEVLYCLLSDNDTLIFDKSLNLLLHDIPALVGRAEISLQEKVDLDLMKSLKNVHSLLQVMEKAIQLCGEISNQVGMLGYLFLKPISGINKLMIVLITQAELLSTRLCKLLSLANLSALIHENDPEERSDLFWVKNLDKIPPIEEKLLQIKISWRYQCHLVMQKYAVLSSNNVVPIANSPSSVSSLGRSKSEPQISKRRHTAEDVKLFRRTSNGGATTLFQPVANELEHSARAPIGETKKDDLIYDLDHSL